MTGRMRDGREAAVLRDSRDARGGLSGAPHLIARASLLTRASKRRTILLLGAPRVKEGMVLLLRNASAGDRLSSPHIDRFRELDDAGRADARQLVWMLAGRPLERVVTSPLARCVQTVVPIAESRRLVVERRNELLPDASVESTMELFSELPDASLVCTHREVILQLFAGEVACEKGGAWVLERQGVLLSPVEYIAPPGVVPDPFQRTASVR